MALDVVEFPEDIAWLDLSFNDITEVSDDILQFQALKMLYLHGNKIKRFADITKLKQLPNLYSLTLHGNPIENQPHYRYPIRVDQDAENVLFKTGIPVTFGIILINFSINKTFVQSGTKKGQKTSTNTV